MPARISLASILAESARRYPDQVALVHDEHRYTFAQLWQRSQVLAEALRRASIARGDRVVLLCPNTVDFALNYYAIVACGAVAVPVHLLLTAPELEWILRDSNACAFLCHPDFAEAARQATASTATPLYSAAHGEELGREDTYELTTLGSAAGHDGHDGEKRYTTFDATPDLADANQAYSSDVAGRGYVLVTADDPAVVLYTSGTTGRPKGAMLSHLNLLMNATVNAFDANQIRPGEVAVTALPLFHSFGQTVAMNATWRAGGTLVLASRFEPTAMIEMLVRENAAVFLGVPTMYTALVQAAPQAERLPKLRLCVSGGTSLPATVLTRFNELFDAPVLEGYGLSETSPSASIGESEGPLRPGTVGRPIWGVEIEICDPTVASKIRPMPYGEVGEIAIRGHNVFSGYLGNQAATDAALIDGWLRTGDLGTKDADGFITVVDRVKDLIIRNGYNVYPREVEEVLLQHPGISQAAVFGLADLEKGEEICAVLVLDPAREPVPSAEEIIAFTRTRLAPYKYPRVIHVVDQMPLGASHKVLKRELRKRFEPASPSA